MSEGMMMGLVIVSLVAVIMIIIGVYQFGRKDCPVGFYNIQEPPKAEEISDILQWNRRHGIIWIVYGLCIEAGFWLGYMASSDVMEMSFMMGGVVIPLPFMVLVHRSLGRKYKNS